MSKTKVPIDAGFNFQLGTWVTKRSGKPFGKIKWGWTFAKPLVACVVGIEISPHSGKYAAHLGCGSVVDLCRLVPVSPTEQRELSKLVNRQNGNYSGGKSIQYPPIRQVTLSMSKRQVEMNSRAYTFPSTESDPDAVALAKANISTAETETKNITDFIEYGGSNWVELDSLGGMKA